MKVNDKTFVIMVLLLVAELTDGAINLMRTVQMPPVQ